MVVTGIYCVFGGGVFTVFYRFFTRFYRLFFNDFDCFFTVFVFSFLLC